MDLKKKKKYTVKLNSFDKIEQLLQETYDLACKQYNQIQEEINKIANSTNLIELDIDGREKYGKIMNNYITLQQKSIAQKFDIAKLMAEVAKHGGDVNGAINDIKPNSTTLDLKELRKLARDVNSSDNKTEEYITKK